MQDGRLHAVCDRRHRTRRSIDRVGVTVTMSHYTLRAVLLCPNVELLLLDRWP